MNIVPTGMGDECAARAPVVAYRYWYGGTTKGLMLWYMANLMTVQVFFWGVWVFVGG